jgi:hypothetical protein
MGVFIEDHFAKAAMKICRLFQSHETEGHRCRAQEIRSSFVRMATCNVSFTMRYNLPSHTSQMISLPATDCVSKCQCRLAQNLGKENSSRCPVSSGESSECLTVSVLNRICPAPGEVSAGGADTYCVAVAVRVDDTLSGGDVSEPAFT